MGFVLNTKMVIVISVFYKIPPFVVQGLYLAKITIDWIKHRYTFQKLKRNNPHGITLGRKLSHAQTKMVIMNGVTKKVHNVINRGFLDY